MALVRLRFHILLFFVWALVSKRLFLSWQGLKNSTCINHEAIWYPISQKHKADSTQRQIDSKHFPIDHGALYRISYCYRFRIRKNTTLVFCSSSNDSISLDNIHWNSMSVFHKSFEDFHKFEKHNYLHTNFDTNLLGAVTVLL